MHVYFLVPTTFVVPALEHLDPANDAALVEANPEVTRRSTKRQIQRRICRNLAIVIGKVKVIELLTTPLQGVELA